MISCYHGNVPGAPTQTTFTIKIGDNSADARLVLKSDKADQEYLDDVNHLITELTTFRDYIKALPSTSDVCLEITPDESDDCRPRTLEMER